MVVGITILVALVFSTASVRADPPKGELYAVLVAGSDGWYNYRHQADVCHAYHTLVNHGVKRENIIVMMYDDIANHHKNSKYMGKIFNSPDGHDVYAGVQIDYKSDAVTPENFLAILSGNTSALEGGNGRVIHGTIEDRIFVYFSDHGGEGLIAFPNSRLTVKRLNVALKEMHRNHKFGQLVFYLEACESGSMFHNILRSNINVYAITAANETESSYATYCDNDLDLPCLGDEFSVNWMEDSDTEDINVETLDYQFQWVREITQKSHVKRYGNMSIAQEPVAWFQGTQKAELRMSRNTRKAQQKKVSWPSRDVELMDLQKKKLLSPQSTAIDLEIGRIQKDRRDIEAVFHSLINILIKDEKERRPLLEKKGYVENLDCHDDVVEAFDTICIDMNKVISTYIMRPALNTRVKIELYDYALKYVYLLNNLCTKFNDSAKIIEAMQKTCSKTRSRFL